MRNQRIGYFFFGSEERLRFFYAYFSLFFLLHVFSFFRAGLGHFFSTRTAQFRSLPAASQTSLSFPPLYCDFSPRAFVPMTMSRYFNDGEH